MFQPRSWAQITGAGPSYQLTSGFGRYFAIVNEGGSTLFGTDVLGVAGQAGLRIAQQLSTVRQAIAECLIGKGLSVVGQPDQAAEGQRDVDRDSRLFAPAVEGLGGGGQPPA